MVPPGIAQWQGGPVNSCRLPTPEGISGLPYQISREKNAKVTIMIIGSDGMTRIRSAEFLANFKIHRPENPHGIYICIEYSLRRICKHFRDSTRVLAGLAEKCVDFPLAAHPV
jgi:hypothetical protein